MEIVESMVDESTDVGTFDADRLHEAELRVKTFEMAVAAVAAEYKNAVQEHMDRVQEIWDSAQQMIPTHDDNTYYKFLTSDEAYAEANLDAKIRLKKARRLYKQVMLTLFFVESSSNTRLRKACDDLDHLDNVG